MPVIKREAPRTASEYVYRRRLKPVDLLPAIGVGIGVGAAAFYIAYLFLQRTPLDSTRLPAAAPAKRLTRGASD